MRTDNATDGAIGPLSGLFTDTTESQIPSHDIMSTNNDDNDNEQRDLIESNLTTEQASAAVGTDGKSNKDGKCGNCSW